MLEIEDLWLPDTQRRHLLHLGLQRTIASPSTVEAFLRAMFEVDARPLLPLIQVPTLVLHRRDLQALSIQHGRWLAECIAGAKLIELLGAEVGLMWETPERVLDVIEEFLTGVRRPAASTRVLATVLFTDLVGSTERARELGNRRWRRLLDMHDELAQRVLEEWAAGWSRRLTTGCWHLRRPGTGIRGAAAFRDQLHGVGLQLRAGLLTGEVELCDGDIGGIGVHLAARVMAAAPGEIFTSRIVPDLVVASASSSRTAELIPCGAPRSAGSCSRSPDPDAARALLHPGTPALGDAIRRRLPGCGRGLADDAHRGCCWTG